MSYNLLYLSEDYYTSKVHHELISKLCDLNDVNAKVLYSVRGTSNCLDITDQYSRKNYESFAFHVQYNNARRYKFDFNYKIKFKLDELNSHLNPKKIDIVHAATLFSEGAVAYRLFKEHGIPYTITVRGTDVNLYLRYMVHLWPLCRRILKNASRIIWSSKHVKEQTLSHLVCKGSLSDEVSRKSVTIHNGIEDFWIENSNFITRRGVARKLLYIGNFTPNKNVLALMDSVEELAREYKDLHLTLVGGGGSDEKKVLEKCMSSPHLFSFSGRVTNKSQLRDIFSQNDVFTMVSHSETFGLVYAEALSQNLPILYTKGQGFDGVVDARIGIPVNSHDYKDIVKGLKTLIEEYSSFETIESHLNEFSWSGVAHEYNRIFNQILYKK